MRNPMSTVYLHECSVLWFCRYWKYKAIDTAHNTKLAVRYGSAPRDIGQLALRLSSPLDIRS